MAYIPPHKRQLKDGESSTPITPDSLPRYFRENVNLRDTRKNKDKHSFQGWKIKYAKNSICRWWPTGSTSDQPIPSTFFLENFPGNTDRHPLGRPLILSSGMACPEAPEVEPWVSIADKILPDLLIASQGLMNEMESGTNTIKPSFTARLGKILFHGDSTLMLNFIKQPAVSEADSRSQLHKSFNTNIPNRNMEYIKNVIGPKIGTHSVKETDHYHVKVLDKSHPDSVMSCKCIMTEDGKKLKVYKVELDPVRHLVVDISCIYKDLDLRLMLSHNKKLTDLRDEVKESINRLVNAATIDQDVKGGLRWPLAEEPIDNHFSILGVWHTRCTVFYDTTMRLKLREADRFDFTTSTGQAAAEVSLKLTEVCRQLQGDPFVPDRIRAMLEGNIKLIYDHFLNCKLEFA